MSSAPQNLDDVFSGESSGGTPQRVSKLAVTSLVLSVIFCCPLTTVAGLVIGLSAVFATIRDRTLSGRWIAVTAIVIATLATIGQCVVGVQGYRTVFAPIFTGPQTALRAGERGDLAAFQECFTSTAAEGNNSDNSQQFLTEMKARYGAFTNAALDTSTAAAQAPAAGQDLVADYQLDFAKGRIRSTCAIEVIAPAGHLSLKIRSVLIHDADKGDMRYPPSQTSEKK